MPTCPTATSDCDGAVFSANAFRIPTDEVPRRDAIAGDLEDRRQATTAARGADRPDHLKPSTPCRRSSGRHTTPNPKFGIRSDLTVHMLSCSDNPCFAS